MPYCSSCGAEIGANGICERCGGPLVAPAHEASSDVAGDISSCPPTFAAMGERSSVRGEAEMDRSVVKAVRKKDVERLVHLAKYSRLLDKSPRGDAVSAQAAQALMELATELGMVRKVEPLTYILVNLEGVNELSAVSHAAMDALVAAGPDGIRELTGRTSTAASKLYAAEVLRRAGDESNADRLVADAVAIGDAERDAATEGQAVSLGRAEYLGGCSGFGPARKGTLSVTRTRILFDERVLVRFSSVASIEVGGGQIAKSRLAATLAFGTVGALGAKASQDRGELAAHLVSGETAFFFVEKMSAAAIRAAVSPLLRAAGIRFKDEADHQAVIDAAAGGAPTSPSLADELLKLAKLHESGILTADELAAAKAKLLS